jgi:hypothetical protein
MFLVDFVNPRQNKISYCPYNLKSQNMENHRHEKIIVLFLFLLAGVSALTDIQSSSATIRGTVLKSNRTSGQ